MKRTDHSCTVFEMHLKCLLAKERLTRDSKFDSYSAGGLPVHCYVFCELNTCGMEISNEGVCFFY